MTITTRGARADARRNHERVLTAAEELFAEHGIAVPLDDIARRAEVGAGTVYRHFPTKEALYQAVQLRRIAEMTTRAHRASQDPEPGTAFYTFLGYAMEHAVLNTALCDAFTGFKDWQPSAGVTVHCDFRDALQTLLRNAQDAAAVRADITVDDVSALIPGYVAMRRHRGPDTAMLRTLLFDGLRPANETKPASFRNGDRNSSHDRNETGPRCPVCDGPIHTSRTGRPARYCSSACRQKAHRNRRATG